MTPKITKAVGQRLARIVKSSPMDVVSLNPECM